MPKFLKRSIKSFINFITFRSLRKHILKRALKKQFNDFISGFQVRDNSVLVFEPNNCHSEIIPGYVKYWSDLGYNVDVLAQSVNLKEKPFDRFHKSEMPRIVAENINVDINFMKLFLKSDVMNKYEFINVTTTNCFSLPGADVFGSLRMTYPKNAMIIAFDHNLLDIHGVNQQEMLDNGQLFVLNRNSFGIPVVNPHYFGDVRITKKNKITTFVCVGMISNKYHNHDLLFNAVDDLIASGMTDFEIVVIGSGKMEIEQKYEKYIKPVGRLDFPSMFSYIEDADFILALLDPTNIGHMRFLCAKSTGALQLSYAFQKPMIINDRFAESYALPENACIRYEDNQLGGAMKLAIQMSPDSYRNMQTSVKDFAESIYEESKNNLNAAINKYKNLMKEKTDSKTVFVVGNSHAMSFSKNKWNKNIRIAQLGGKGTKYDNITMNLETSPRFCTFWLGPGLAYSAFSDKSSMKTKEKTQWLMQSGYLPKNCKVLSVFGEVDCRCHIEKIANEQKRSIESVVDDVIENYGNYLLMLKHDGYDVGAWGGIASQNNNVIIDPQFPRYGTMYSRNKITKLFDEKLRDFCKQNSIKFYSILDNLLDENLGTKTKYYSDEIHLGDEAFKLIEKVVR